ncbi:NfeD family protein [Thermodesulfovibrionales bacterium]|nr:NfeD family protein [Thermodesulfovibrionales bacterium]MCL0061269.1 NfeD family protein [Thermodesulfovibrionales bacterium]
MDIMNELIYYIEEFLPYIIGVIVLLILFFGILIKLSLDAHKRRPVTGKEGIIGCEGVATTDITSDGGMVLMNGEAWSAYSDDIIRKKTRVVVDGIKGLRVKVKRASLKT